MDAKSDDRSLGRADNTVKAVVSVYLHRTQWRPNSVGGSLAGRRRCIRPAGGGTGDCTRSYRGWALSMRGVSKLTT